MPHTQAPFQIFTVTAVSYSTLTLTANSGYNAANLYAGLIGNLRLNALATPVIVTEIVSLGVVRVGVPTGSGQNVPSIAVDLTAYNGGTLYFETQPVYVESEIPTGSVLTSPIVTTPVINGVTVTTEMQQSTEALSIAFSNLTDLDTGVSPTPGYIHRGTGTAGAVTKALADSEANADVIVGVGDASLGLRPLSVPGEIIFDSLPVIHTTAYLSATVAGQATCTMPVIARVLGTVDTIVSAEAPFRALVTPLLTGVGEYHSLREKLIRVAETELATSGDELGILFSDYDMQDLVYKAGTGWQPNWGQFTDVNWTSDTGGNWCPISCCMLSATMKHSYTFPIGKFGNLAAKPWIMGMRAIMAPTGGNAHLMRLRCLGGAGGIGLGTYYYDPDVIKLGYGTQDPLTAVENYGTYVTVGSRTADYQTVWLKSIGDGTIKARIGDGAWPVSAAYNPADSAGVEIAHGTQQTYTACDWFFFAHKVR